MNIDLEYLRRRWKEDRPKYEQFCQAVEDHLKSATRECGIACTISSRIKETHSLLKKAIRKSYDDPYEDIRDKTGVRIVCTFRDTLPQLEEVIRAQFQVCGYENKPARLAYDRLGYMGIHFEVKFQENCSADAQQFDGLVCELQILTRAQSLWADISHELTYKPSEQPPEDLKRQVYLQGALLEIFDNQMRQARTMMSELHDFPEARLLDELDKHFFRFTSYQYDRELSIHILGQLLVLFSDDEVETFGSLLDEFVERKKDVLAPVFEAYAEDSRRNPLLFQPESIVIYLCIERDVFKLKATWSEFLPIELLGDLATVWGEDIGIVP